MNKDKAYSLFEELIKIAQEELLRFTLSASLDVDTKADKSVVTECDKAIDAKMTEISQSCGLQVVSEESEHDNEIVKSGNYITIDPIDGTLGYIDYVNEALGSGNIGNFLKKDLGAEHDFSLLLGIVENSKSRFAACFNYVTKEKIFIDADNRQNFIRENNVREYSQKDVVYLDQRFLDDPLTKRALSLPDVTPITQATFGLKSLYTIINPHENAVTIHRVQSAGLWDVLPAATAARVFGGEVFDDEGSPLVLDRYVILPGNGATVVRGDKFKFVEEELKKSS